MTRSVERRVRVQQSFPDPRSTTNPYIVMLRDALAAEPGIEVRTFTWRRALLGRYDVFHAHWPEILVGGASRPKAAVRQGLTALLWLRLALTRTPLVRTAHNLDLPSGLTAVQRALLRVGERRTALRVVLTEATPLPAGTAAATVPHGHYRDWFAVHPRAAAVPGRAVFVGLVRRYKGVEQLVEAFRALPGADRGLRVAGRPSTPELARAVRELAAGDDRIALRLEFLDEPDLVAEITAAQLVVLPYREMHNSGTVLAALSLDRPVLVPRNAATERLRDEVGGAWVITFDGTLTADDLGAAFDAAARTAPGTRPDLSARDWSRAGAEHLTAYRRALGWT